MSRPRDFTVLRKSDPHFLLEMEKGRLRARDSQGLCGKIDSLAYRAFANADLGFQLQTHGIHQPIAIGRIVNTEGKGD